MSDNEPAGRPDRRVSDAEREQAAEAIRSAVADGRLDLDEIDPRIGAALASRTRSELDAVLSDLGDPPAVDDGSVVTTLTATGSGLTRHGRWQVPERLAIEARASNVRLDFTEAVFAGATCQLHLDVSASSVRLIVPDDVAVESSAVPTFSSVNVELKRPVVNPRAVIRISGTVSASNVSAAQPGWRRRRQLRKASPRLTP